MKDFVAASLTSETAPKPLSVRAIDADLKSAREELDDFLFFWKRSLLPMRAERALAAIERTLNGRHQVNDDHSGATVTADGQSETASASSVGGRL